MIILQHPDHRDSPILFPGNLRGLKIRPTFGNELRHHCLLQGRTCNFIHPGQLSPFPERLEMPFSIDEILSGYEDIVSSGTDQFTAWVKMDPHEVLVHHVVDVQKSYRRLSARHQKGDLLHLLRQTVPTHFSTRSPMHKRLSICNWNPGPRLGKEDAFEKQIAGRWHVITLQEASEYVDHDILTGRFHVTHYAGCAIGRLGVARELHWRL